MNILVISHMFPVGSEDNSGIFVQELLLSLSTFCEIFVISPKPFVPPFYEKFFPSSKNYKIIDKNKKIKNVNVFYVPYLRFPGKTFFHFEWISIFFAIYGVVVKLKKNHKIDLIHSHSVLPDGLVALIFGKYFNIPTVCTAHGSDINVYPFRDKLSFFLSKIVLERTTSMAYVSNALKMKADEIAIVNNQSIITNGYDPIKFFPMDNKYVREKLNLSDKAFILFIGNFLEIKGVKLLIPILKKMLENNENFQLISIGAGELKESIEKDVSKYNLGNNFLLFDRQPHEKIPLWINAADLIIMPSLSEGFPTLIPEVIACGRPIVAFNVGGIPEIINSDVGFLVSVGDINMFVDKVILALNKQWDTEKIINLSKDYSWNSIALKYLNLYKKLTSS